jgi:hypothetical protein
MSPDRPGGASLARRGGIVGWGINNSDRFAKEIQCSPDLTMPQTPADPLDGLGEGGHQPGDPAPWVGPALRRPRDVLNPHREMKPCVDRRAATPWV